MIEQEVARHYTHGSLHEAIGQGLSALGRAHEDVTTDDLAAVDEFHMGGRPATVELAERLNLASDMAVLDIGSGIGGTARFLARRFGCRVTGIDLTPEYVSVAEALTRRTGLEGLAKFRLASALELPFGEAQFDAATLLHVGMNIPDKTKLCAETARVLKAGGKFAVYDVMRTGSGALDFPVPWAETPETSSLDEPEVYRRALSAAGFEIVAERERRQFALDFFLRMKARVEQQGLPPLGLHILMGATAPKKVAHMIAGLSDGRIAPVEMICRKKAA